LQHAQATARQWREAAERDPLTGLHNRRALRETTAFQVCGIVGLDLDRFKEINDTHGHAVGDRVLVIVASLLRTAFDDPALIMRLGGDEFAVVGASLEALTDGVTRIENLLRQHPWTSLARDLHVEASLGTVVLTPGETVCEALERCDVVMYARKRGRRDSVLHVRTGKARSDACLGGKP
jgi:diguanylate cyclase (GGDEF)-like protein